MKQQIITGLKKELLLVEIGGELSDEFIQIMNEHGMAEILGKLTDIKEEQFEEWVDNYEWEENSYGGKYAFRDYKDGKETDDYWDMYPFDTAKESFLSYLQSNGIYFENPYEEPIVLYYEDDYEDNVMAHILLNQWKEAQSKVWDINRTYLFEILK